MQSTSTKDAARPSTRNSFSIKNILNLKEEEAVHTPGGLDAVLKDSKCPVPVAFAPPASSAMRPPFLYPCVYGLPTPQYTNTNWPHFGLAQQLPAWIYNTRFMRHGFIPGYSPYTNLRRRRRFAGKRKQRPLFSQQQVQTMEEEFTKHRYVTEMKRAELASELGLTETQIKTWFQNRRTKWRKEIRDEVATTVAKTQKRWHTQGRFSGSSVSETEEFSQRKATFDIC